MVEPTSLIRRAVSLIAVACIVLLLPACLGGDDAGDSVENRPGQITRPGDVGLPLDNPISVQAFDRADQLLLDWFILDDPDLALLNFSSNLRPTWASIFDGTTVEGDCSFTQVEGRLPDQSGTVTARYAIDGCRVAPPGNLTASHVTVTVTVTEQNAWVVNVEFD